MRVRYDPPSADGLRLILAGSMLTTMLVLQVLSTISLRSVQTNNLSVMLVFACCLFLVPEVRAGLSVLKQSRMARMMGFIGLATMMIWSLVPSGVFLVPRFWLYVGLLLLFAGVVGWSRASGDRVVRRIFIAKLWITLFALALITRAMLASDSPLEVAMNLPIYRWIRHLNFDLAILAGLMMYFASAAPSRIGRGAYLVAFAVIGYFSAWSGGRGQMVALLVFFAALATTGALSWRDRRWWAPILALAVGAAAVFVSGATELLLGQLGKVAADSVDAVSSGRLVIWKASIKALAEWPVAIPFGLGPEAFDRMRVADLMQPRSELAIVQPHNTVVQALLEFGVVGTLLLVTAYARLAWKGVRILRAPTPFDLPKTVSALLLALLAYSLTDGLFYHAIPLTLIVMLSAYLFAIDMNTYGARRSRTGS